MSTIQLGEYSAWICIEGAATQVYNIEKASSTSASGWIASQIGKKFSVNWYNTERRIPIQAQVHIDGKLCDTHIMLDARRFPNKPNGVGVSYARTSDWTRRDFQFTNILVSDDDAYLHTVDQTLDIGTITLQLWRIEIDSVSTETLRHQYGGLTLDNEIVHERSKKAGAHHVVYGQEYTSPAPTVDMVRGKLLDSTPLVTFTFKYRPYDILRAHEIIPAPATPSKVASSSRLDAREEMDEKTAAQIRRLEKRLTSLKAKGKVVPDAGIVKKPYNLKREKGRSASMSIPAKAEVIDLTWL